MTIRESDSPTHDPGAWRLTPWQRVAALAIVALVVVVVVIVTQSAEAVAVVVTPLLLLLGWLSTGDGSAQ